MACHLLCDKPPIELILLNVNWTLMNKYQWHFSLNWNIFIQENAFGNADIIEIISLQIQYVNALEYTNG